MLNTLAALATCVIIVPTDHPKVSEHTAYIHELAHCNGWEHGTAFTRANIVPPKRFVRKPKGMNLEVNRYPLAIAEKVCAIYGAHSGGCQWTE